jgi:hypothetical protein
MAEFKTSDLGLAAFLVMRGLRLVSADRLDSGRFEFALEDPDEKSKGLSIEYVGSEFCQFDNQVRTLKKLLYSAK